MRMCISHGLYRFIPEGSKRAVCWVCRCYPRDLPFTCWFSDQNLESMHPCGLRVFSYESRDSVGIHQRDWQQGILLEANLMLELRPPPLLWPDLQAWSVSSWVCHTRQQQYLLLTARTVWTFCYEKSNDFQSLPAWAIFKLVTLWWKTRTPIITPVSYPVPYKALIINIIYIPVLSWVTSI